MSKTIFLAAVLAGLFFCCAEPVRASQQCFDLAVIGTSPHYRWVPVEVPIDEIIIRSPVSISFSVVERLAGISQSGRIVANTSLHTRFNSQIKLFLLFLRRQKNGEYELLNMDYRIVRDRRGDFVIPVAEPLSEEELSPEGFKPTNYEALLRPSRYRVADAWWLADEKEVPPWSLVKYGKIAADKSLPVRDLVKAMDDRRCNAAP